jgi:hypothetical protein
MHPIMSPMTTVIFNVELSSCDRVSVAVLLGVLHTPDARAQVSYQACCASQEEES